MNKLVQSQMELLIGKRVSRMECENFNADSNDMDCVVSVNVWFYDGSMLTIWTDHVQVNGADGSINLWYSHERPE